MPGDASASAELMAGREEAFARVALAGELLIFTPKLVPQRVKGFVVGPMDDVTESVMYQVSKWKCWVEYSVQAFALLMEHGVDHFLQGYELPLIVRISQSQTDFLAVVPI